MAHGVFSDSVESTHWRCACRAGPSERPVSEPSGLPGTVAPSVAARTKGLCGSASRVGRRSSSRWPRRAWSRAPSVGWRRCFGLHAAPAVRVGIDLTVDHDWSGGETGTPYGRVPANCRTGGFWSCLSSAIATTRGRKRNGRRGMGRRLRGQGEGISPATMSNSGRTSIRRGSAPSVGRRGSRISRSSSRWAISSPLTSRTTRWRMRAPGSPRAASTTVCSFPSPAPPIRSDPSIM